MIYRDRQDGGEQLGEVLREKNIIDPVVIGLPRGGVITAYEVAKRLHCPLEIVIVRKIGSPLDPEYGIGAMSEDEECFFPPEGKSINQHQPQIQKIIEEERAELRRRIKYYRGRALQLPPAKTLIVVDDGLATGVSATAALMFLKKFQPARLIFAAPVGPSHIRQYLKELCDEIILLTKPPHFQGVGMWYEDFQQTTDEEVIKILSGNRD